MKNKFEQRLKELERKSKYYDLATEKVIINEDLEKDIDDIWVESNFEELNKKVDASKSAYKFITVALVSAVLVFVHRLFSFQRPD